MSNLSDRLRPNTEAAPWVIAEVIKLEKKVREVNAQMSQVTIHLRNENKTLPTWAQVMNRMEKYHNRVTGLETELKQLKAEVADARKAWLGDDYGHLPLKEAMELYRTRAEERESKLESQVEELELKLTDSAEDWAFCGLGVGIGAVAATKRLEILQRYRDKAAKLRTIVDSLFGIINRANPGAFTNGNTHPDGGGPDEGEVLTGQHLSQLMDEVKAIDQHIK